MSPVIFVRKTPGRCSLSVFVRGSCRPELGGATRAVKAAGDTIRQNVF